MKYMKKLSILGLLIVPGLLLVILAPPVEAQADPPPDPLFDLAPEVRDHRDLARGLGLFRDREGTVFGKGLSKRIESGSEAEITVWVFFTDKGIGTRESLEKGLIRVRDGLTDRARRRREALGSDLGLSFTDKGPATK